MADPVKHGRSGRCSRSHSSESSRHSTPAVERSHSDALESPRKAQVITATENTTSDPLKTSPEAKAGFPAKLQDKTAPETKPILAAEAFRKWRPLPIYRGDMKPDPEDDLSGLVTPPLLRRGSPRRSSSYGTGSPSSSSSLDNGVSSLARSQPSKKPAADEHARQGCEESHNSTSRDDAAHREGTKCAPLGAKPGALGKETLPASGVSAFNHSPQSAGSDESFADSRSYTSAVSSFGADSSPLNAHPPTNDPLEHFREGHSLFMIRSSLGHINQAEATDSHGLSHPSGMKVPWPGLTGPPSPRHDGLHLSILNEHPLDRRQQLALGQHSFFKSEPDRVDFRTSEDKSGLPPPSRVLLPPISRPARNAAAADDSFLASLHRTIYELRKEVARLREKLAAMRNRSTSQRILARHKRNIVKDRVRIVSDHVSSPWDAICEQWDMMKDQQSLITAQLRILIRLANNRADLSKDLKRGNRQLRHLQIKLDEVERNRTQSHSRWPQVRDVRFAVNETSRASSAPVGGCSLEWTLPGNQPRGENARTSKNLLKEKRQSPTMVSPVPPAGSSFSKLGMLPHETTSSKPDEAEQFEPQKRTEQEPIKEDRGKMKEERPKATKAGNAGKEREGGPELKKKGKQQAEDTKIMYSAGVDSFFC